MTEITLDWDINFDDVRDSVSFGVLRRFVVANRSKVGDVFIRRSSRGNTHVKFDLLIPSCIGMTSDSIDIMVMDVRGFLRDDVYRLKLDHVRHLVDNPCGLDLSQWKPGGSGGVGRLWDWKVNGGVEYEAGDWERVEL